MYSDNTMVTTSTETVAADHHGDDPEGNGDGEIYFIFANAAARA